MPSEHAKLSPSAAKRWLNCPGSVALCATVIDTGGADADQGTAGHKIFELALSEGRAPRTWLGQKIDCKGTLVEVTAELVGWVEEALEWVEEYRETHPGCVLYTEEKINIGATLDIEGDVLWGTCDLFIISGEELVVFDLKLGITDVQAQANPQLSLYALGFARGLSCLFDRVRLVIHQPRSGGAKEAVLSTEELEALREYYRPRVLAALDPAAPLVASDEACDEGWCKARGICPERQKMTLALAREEFAAIDTLPVEALVTLLDNADRIRAALKAAEEHALKLATLGHAIPGYKLVDAQGRRAWLDPAGAAEAAKAHGVHPYAEPELLTPAQLEAALAGVVTATNEKGKVTKKACKELAAEMLKPFTYKPTRGPTLVKESDEREALEGDFEVVEDALP